jgi:hypothetical protein
VTGEEHLYLVNVEAGGDRLPGLDRIRGFDPKGQVDHSPPALAVPGDGLSERDRRLFLAELGDRERPDHHVRGELAGRRVRHDGGVNEGAVFLPAEPSGAGHEGEKREW